MRFPLPSYWWVFLLSSFSSHTTTNLHIAHEQYKLENGLNVILAPDHSLPLVGVNLWYQVGAAHENPKTAGLAHFFEHLMFEGSHHAKEHFKILEKAGGSNINATTSFDRTNYFETVPKDKLELALALEASRMTFLILSKEKLEEQRAVVLRELEQRQENAAYGSATTALWQSIFKKGHPFHGRVLGNYADISAISLDQMTAFYEKNYAPANASLALVGDFDPKDAKKLILKYFGTFPKTNRSIPETFEIPKISTEKIIRFEENFGQLPLVRMQYLTPALYQPGDAELDVLAHILAGNDAARLKKTLIREKKLANSVSVTQQSMENLSIFTIDLLINPNIDPQVAILEADKILADIMIEPPSDDEVQRAIKKILTNYFFGLQDLEAKAELLQSYNRFAKNTDYIQTDVERYLKITAKDLPKIASSYLKKSSRHVLIASPKNLSIPKER